jgi:hypothetical protein
MEGGSTARPEKKNYGPLTKVGQNRPKVAPETLLLIFYALRKQCSSINLGWHLAMSGIVVHQIGHR